jgi:hypothetical protein
MRLRSRGRGPSEHARLPSEAVLGPRCLSGSLALLSLFPVQLQHRDCGPGTAEAAIHLFVEDSRVGDDDPPEWLSG